MQNSLAYLAQAREPELQAVKRGAVRCAALSAAALMANCAATPHAVPAPVAGPTLIGVAPASNPWPIPLDVYVHNRDGRALVGQLPGLTQLPSDYVVAPRQRLRSAAEYSAFIDEVRSHELTGVALAQLPALGAEFAALATLPKLERLDLSGTHWDANHFLPPQLAPQLTHLQLANTNVTDAQLLPWLVEAAELRVLDLANTNIGDGVVLALAGQAPLVALNASDTLLTDGVADAIAKVPTLRVVDVSRTRVANRTVAALVRLPLVELYLGDTQADARMASLASLANSIERLDVSNLNLDDRALAWLANAQVLRGFYGNGTAITDATVLALAKHATVLEVDVGRTRVSSRAAIKLTAAPELRLANFAATAIGNDGAAALLAAPHLQVLQLDETVVSDAAFAAAKPQALRELYLAKTRVGDGLAAILQYTPQLQALGLRATAITDGLLAHLPAHLHVLDLGGNALSAPALAVLGRQQQLRKLFVDDTAADDAVVRGLVGARDLRVLHLGKTAISDDGVAVLAGLPNLQELELSNCALTNAALEAIAKLHQLHTLSLAGTAVDDATALQPLRRLRRLDLSRSRLPSLARITAAKLSALRELGISGTPVMGAHAGELRQLASLGKLWAAGTGFSSVDASAIAAMPRLYFVDLRKTRLGADKAAIARLKSARPALQVCTVDC